MLFGHGYTLPLLNIRYPSNFSQIIKELHLTRNLNILHDHGMWLPSNHAAAQSCKRLNIPYVVSPRGMLEPWSLGFKAWKKKLAWKTWVNTDLQNATAFCATAPQEAESIRKLGFRQPIAVIPNGVEIQALQIRHNQNVSLRRQALFLSRVHPKKGVCELIEAWARVRPFGWKLLIAGPDEDGHAMEVNRCISRHGLDSAVRLVGPIDGESKWKLYQQSDLFVLPTFSENFGIVVAESLAMGTPVITTKGAPWEGLVKHNCGWWIDLGVENLVQALREATALSDETRSAMGEHGRQFVGQSFAWEAIAKQMQMFYMWLLGQVEKPDFVRGTGE
jgi:glycosyltransferase involved in cell wall biosynthesis